MFVAVAAAAVLLNAVWVAVAPTAAHRLKGSYAERLNGSGMVLWFNVL